MRGDRATRDTRHNKDFENLKSSLKKGSKIKKNRVVFDESANEFFEADYIIVVRDDCRYSNKRNTEECCEACDHYQEPETGALSPPEGYKDMGLFNRDGTLREQAWWEAGDVLLVGERSGTVFTPQHLQLLKKLQKERMLRSSVCADCDSHTTVHPPHDMEYNYEDEENSDVDKELRRLARRTGKHIAAGEERPRMNSSQQTTPTEECPPDICMKEPHKELRVAPRAMCVRRVGDENETEAYLSSETSPLRQRRSGILKGGRLWKSIDNENTDPNDDQRSATTSDDDGSISMTRTVRFIESPKRVEEEVVCIEEVNDSDTLESDNESAESQKGNDANKTHRLETPLILTTNATKANSAVQQLFNSNRPPPPAIEPQLITSETLRAWDAGAKPKTEEAAVKRVAERNALRCSLLRNEARKKQQPKQETTSLAERIRLLTCDVEDEDQPQEPRISPAGASSDKFSSSDKSSEKSYTMIDKNNEKAFGSASSSSSSSTLSVPVPTRQQPPDLGDVHQETQKPKPEPRRQFLSTLAPLTACVGMDGSTAHHEGFYYMSPGDRISASAATSIDLQEHNDSPAPDVVAGTPGASDNDESLAAFARASASRTERIRQRYGQESQPVSSDDEHDDYGFHRRPAVRGIAVKQQLGASDDILQQMQNELQPTASSTATSAPAHSCQRTNSNYSWPYYSEANLNSRPQSRSSINSNWCKSDYASARQCTSTPVQQHADSCYAHAQNIAQYARYQHRQQDNVYRNCSLYANIGCSDSSQELYSSQTSSEPTSPVRNRRPESPPPIRTHHQLLYVPYSNHYHYQQDYAQTWTGNEYSRMQPQYQQTISGATAVQTAVQPQRAHYTHALQVQTLCPAPARYRPVPAPQPGGGKQMICYSEKVAAPLYQPAPGSPSRSTRGVPEGAASIMPAPTATSPMTAPPNPVYYAMNV